MAEKDFRLDAEDQKPSATRVKVLSNGLIYKPKSYEYSDEWVPADINNPHEIHSTHEMIEHLLKNPKAQIDARVLGMAGDQRRLVKMGRKDFLEAVKRRDSKKFRETIDSFQFDDGGVGGDLIGRDFTPLLGGPFNKQLYYRDYLRMISKCFFAYHHDPVARDIVSIIVDFTMGRGFNLVATGKDKDAAQVMWEAFYKVNNLQRQIEHMAIEMSIYGETMWWWLPNFNARISFQPGWNEKVPKAVIPRVRLIDPSNIAEVITVPEDPIDGVLYYVWLAPTQYQMWTAGQQPTTKFIYQQLPADQIMHHRINSVSNEKRGRSDFFPALGYMKRLRDGVNYALVAQQKAAAWCIDTTIEGDQSDIDQYVSDQQSQGAIPAAGSEFVHTKAVTREYLSNAATSKGADSPVFSWCLNMICMAAGIPMSYLGTHLSGAGNRASALVSTEPVAKRFERRRLVYDRVIRNLFDGLMQRFGLNAECEIQFPELITQDRTAKINDVTKAQMNSYISHKRAAEIVAKELDVKDFDYQAEQTEILKDDKALGITPAMTAPLTTPGGGGQTGNGKTQSALSAPEKTKIKSQLRTL